MAAEATKSIDVRSGPEGPAPAASYRPDIDGLRAVSIILVVLFHAGVGAFSGGYVGVDVFFVISGFLITGLLLDEHARAGRISMSSFYARRMRRLLPLSALVLVTTVVVGRVLLSPLDQGTLLADARAAALYFANWRFAAQAGAYSDTGPTDSLLVHYWSLSIEEQFYLLWPLLLVGVGFLARRRPALFRPVLGASLAVLGVGSLIASALLTPSGVTVYYVTHVRVWELAAGAGLALARPLLRTIPAGIAGVAGIAGMGCIVLAAMTFGQDTIFPGTAALLPVAGSMLVLIAGSSARSRVSRVLSAAPLPAIGRVSYGWYLWHWPAIGVALLIVGSEAPGGSLVVAKAIAVAASFVLAIVSHRLVEQPFRRSPRLNAAPRVSIALGVVLTMVPVAMTVAQPEEPAPQILGTTEVRLVMTPAEARDDASTRVGACRSLYSDVEIVEPCAFGDLEGKRTIALVGDSHGEHWFPVFDRVAKQEGWRLLVWTKAACPVIDVLVKSSNRRPYEHCSQWRRALFEQLASYPGKLDLVVIGRSQGYRSLVLDEDGERALGPDFSRLWRRGASRTFDALLEASHRVLVLEDTPWATHDVPSCLSEDPGDPAGCSFPAEGQVDGDAELVAAERKAVRPGVRFADLTHALCPGDTCPAVTEDGLIIYRDAHHMTARFNRTLAPVVAEILRPLVRRA